MSSICKKCFFYDEPLCSYQRNVKVACDICKYFKPIPQTLFDRITASPETLAPKFIYTVRTSDGEQRWCSALLEVGSWFSESDAIAATVAKLKEVS